MEPTEVAGRIDERHALEAELASPYREVRVLERIAASIIRESLIEHHIEDETDRRVTCGCGDSLKIEWSSTSTIRVHQADAAAAALADFSAREPVTA